MTPSDRLGTFTLIFQTMALLSLYTAGRSDDNFSQANEFYPRRWIRTDQMYHRELNIFKPQASIVSRNLSGLDIKGCKPRFLKNHFSHLRLELDHVSARRLQTIRSTLSSQKYYKTLPLKYPDLKLNWKLKCEWFSYRKMPHQYD